MLPLWIATLLMIVSAPAQAGFLALECKSKEGNAIQATVVLTGHAGSLEPSFTLHFSGEASVLVRQGRRDLVNEKVNVKGKLNTKSGHRYSLAAERDENFRFELLAQKSNEFESKIQVSGVGAPISLNCQYVE